MRLVDRPRAWLIASTTLQAGNLAAGLDYLGHDGSKYVNDALMTVDVDLLPESAGRVCYDSFTNRRPGGNKAYLDRIKDQGHGCYDGETEVLTADGWKDWEDVTLSDLFATINNEGFIEYQKPLALTKQHYCGRMYRVDSQQVDLLVTPNHRMYVCPTTTREGRKKSKYEFVEAEELATRSHAYLKVGTWKGGHAGYSYPDLYALLGFTIGDGSVGSAGCVRFRLHRQRKITWLRNIVGRLGYVLDEIDDRFIVHLPEAVRELFSQIYNEYKEKQIPPWTLHGLNEKYLEALYYGLMQADGSEGTGWSFCTTSSTLASQFQILCLHTGRCANQGETYDRARRPTSYGDKPLHRFHVTNRCDRPEVNKWSGAAGKTYWIENWSGMVYCAQVPNGTLYVRRNGRPVWCGNSVLEHTSFSFLITDISRGCSHELVRHRAGWAYSQRSTRYVDETQGGVVVPHALRGLDPNHQAVVFFKLAAEQAFESYDHVMFYLDGEVSGESTERRKALRQTARSVLPTALVTTLVATANARALRHFFEMRASPHADPEIRQLAVLLYDLVSTYELFSDYEKVTLPDGSYALNTRWKKV